MKKRLAVMAIVLMLIFSNVFVPIASAWGVDINLCEDVKATTCTGDILVSPDGTNWGSGFNCADLAAVPSNSLPAMLTPVSFNPVSRSFTSVILNNGIFSSSLAPLQSYIKYTFYAKLPYITGDTTIVSLTADLKSMASFAYAAVDVGSNIYLLNSTGLRSYYPVNSGCFGVDQNNNNIIDHTEVASSVLGLPVTANIAPMSIPLTFTKPGEIKAITVYMWAEGQDPACSGLIPASVAALSMSLTAPVAVKLNITNNNAIINGTYYVKVGLLKNYKSLSIPLGYRTNLAPENIAKVEWSSDNKHIVVDQTGKCKPTVNGKCSSNITVKITDTGGKIYKNKIILKLYKFSWDKDKKNY